MVLGWEAAGCWEDYDGEGQAKMIKRMHKKWWMIDHNAAKKDLSDAY